MGSRCGPSGPSRPQGRVKRLNHQFSADKQASRDVFAIDYSRVVDDVLPCGLGFSLLIRRNNLDATIDAASVPFDHLSLQPIRNVPSVH